MKPDQVDRLVQALASSPLLQIHISRRWWDGAADDTTMASEATPSLTDGSSSSPTTLFSHADEALGSEQRSPGKVRLSLEEGFARTRLEEGRSKVLVSPLSTSFGGIALVDPKVYGSPICLVSRDYRLGARVLEHGACSYHTLAYGTTVQSNLRIEPPSSRSANCRVLLQVLNQTLERRTGEKSHLLLAELDVTESFTRAALAELSVHAGISLWDIQQMASSPRAEEKGESFNWCALADELSNAKAVGEMIEAAASAFANLTAETCTMQTLTMMSELERLKTQHQDFLVLRSTGRHANGMVSGLHVPYVSQHLDRLLYTVSPSNKRGEASRAARLLRDRVVAAVAGNCRRESAFDVRIWWGDQMRQVHCVPLHEDTGGEPTAWAAFLSGESEFVAFTSVLS
ncbi:hypothetical protein BAUCODRAFT_391056 [Baudoinia panamericana UAMH 10762]|uniref:Uncharacterized protein n=1 Tax=Baudoinia panamericana (strain UAMH 10762) TaxID=717646 RepID=M2LWQ6_BAUPA|nr:uncharacterized protein BAUCODRAFT_391056 [Baudoinia panamericana UAMH 10762]EMC99097.1 hypothetical protein BAUCODRAFT_391056 [Baudoinia panamericana UAMH 10762]